MAIDAAQLRVVVSADTSKAQSELKSFSGSMKNAAGQMAGIGTAMSLGITTPLVGMAVGAVKTAASFEKSMNVLGYVTEGTSAQMQAMSDQALQLGADTVFSANEAAEGMVELAKAGMDTEDVMGAIPGVMDLAAAGQISVAEAAELASSTLNTFGLAAEDSAKVADVLAAAANASSADVKDLAFGVQNAGSVFAANGQSVETLATMMALLANNGIDAGTAATQLKTMTLRLTAPTLVASKAMKNLGLAVYDADGNMRDYHDILEDMEVATKDMSDAQRNAAYQVIFGQDAISAANVFIQEGIAGYEDMNAQVKEFGASSEMAAAQNSGLAGAMEAISGSLETLSTKIALPFLDTIAEQMGKVTEFVNGLGELEQPVINAGLAFLGLAAGIGLVLVGAAGLTGIIGALATPIGLAVLAVALLGLAVAGLWVAWETNWGNIQGKTEEALAVIQPLIDAFAAGMTTISTAASDIGTKFVTAFTNAEIPTFDELFADLLAGDFGSLTSKLQVALDSLVLNLKVQLTPEQPAAVKPGTAMVVEPPEGFTEIPETVASRLTEDIKAHDWEGTGHIMAAAIGGPIKAGLLGFDWAKQFIIEFTFPSMANEARDAAIRDWFTGLVDAVVGVFGDEGAWALASAEASKGWQTMLNTILTDFFGPAEDATSTSDILREKARTTTAQMRWEDIMPDPLVWATYIPNPLNWATFIPNILYWTDWIGGKLNWFDWIKPFDPSAVFGGLGEGSMSGGRPEHDFPQVDMRVGKVPGHQSLRPELSIDFAAAGTEMGGTFSTAVTPVGTDIGQKAAAVLTTHAALTKGPDPILSQQKDLMAEDFTLPTLDWATFVVPLNWAEYLTALIWDSYVGRLAWESFVTILEWGSHIPDLSWGNYISTVDWGRYIPTAPIESSGPAPKNASGTPYFRGGQTWVGEQGPELVTLPQGSRIYSNEESMGMGGTTINVFVDSINSALDIEALAAQLARRFQQKMRS